MSPFAWKLLRWTAPIGLIPLFACLGPPVESPNNVVIQESNVRVQQNVKDKVDLLFMVDNSPSMAPKQDELRKKFPQLIATLDRFASLTPASYHIGVVTSDLGAGKTCQGTGDGGKLVFQSNIFANDPTQDPLSGKCTPPKDGHKFIIYDQKNHANDNLPAGQDLPTTFSCATDVGDHGCGLEHQLESPFKALHDYKTIPENTDFLRDDALLAVVWVTDEDDCSAPAGSILFDGAHTEFGVVDSFRCTEYGIVCNGQPVPRGAAGPFTGCQSGPNPANTAASGKLWDISRYINFFTRGRAQGGVKLDPQDVILASIAAPPDPVQVHMEDCDPSSNQPTGTQCATLNHSCVAQSDPKFFGDPAVRLTSVVNSAANHQTTSICETDYSPALNKLGEQIISAIRPGCLDAPLAQPVDCAVQDVTILNDGTEVHTPLKRCTDNGGVKPCWDLDNKLQQYMNENCSDPSSTTCTLGPLCKPQFNPISKTMELYGVVINRDAPPPPGTTARVACSTIASTSGQSK